jgi:pimeloyl-ACP methyl ester carboxylesterase
VFALPSHSTAILTFHPQGSDPDFINSPSGTTAILTTTTLYYLSNSFLSSAFVYAQNPNGFKSEYTLPATDAPLLYTAAKWNILYWPKEYVAKIGNLVRYTELEKGGHFLGLDNPEGLVSEIRELGAHW